MPHLAVRNSGTQPIEAIRVGMRVLGNNPDASEVDTTLPDPNAAHWSKLSLRMTKGNGDVLSIELLRPLEWLIFHEVAVGRTIDLDLSEMGADGPAEVLAVEPCPPIRPGPGSVITGTFAHRSSGDLVNLHVAGEPRPIGVTRNHRYWSEDRLEFVAAGDLRVGERLQAASGQLATVIAITPRPADEPVYNLEVYQQHVYRVGELGVLVHNSCTNGRSDIALGYRNLYRNRGQLSTEAIGQSVESLRPFARKTGAKAYWDWGELNPELVGMRRGVLRAANRAVDNGGKVHFNLDGFRNKGSSFRDAVARGRAGTGTITEQELSWILANERLRDSTVFYRGGKVVADPSRLFGDMW